MKKTIVDLIDEIGADEIKYQKLSSDMTRYQYKSRKHIGEVTFITDPENIDKNKEAIIVWVDKDVMSSAFDRLKEQS